MKQLFPYVPRRTLEEIHKLHARPHLDYGDIIYHIPKKDSHVFGSVDDNINPLMAQVESVQHEEAAHIVSGAWKGTSRTKLYADLGW